MVFHDKLKGARHKAHGHPDGHDVSNTPTPNVPKRNKSISAARGAVDRQIDRARAKIGAEKHRRTKKRAEFKTPIERKAAAKKVFHPLGEGDEKQRRRKGRRLVKP